MKKLLAVLFILPLLSACDPLTPVDFEFDGYNVPRRGAIIIRVQDEVSSGPILVSERFHGEARVHYCRNEATSYCDDTYDLPVSVVDAKTGDLLAGPYMCRISDYRVNVIVYYMVGNQGRIDCNEGVPGASWQKSAPLSQGRASSYLFLFFF